MSLIVKNADGHACAIGCVNNAGHVKFLPEYQKLFDILYELGSFGATNGPNAGTTETDFDLPSTSQVVFEGSTPGPGFLEYVSIPDTHDQEDPFYFAGEGPTLYTNYSILTTEIEWESDVDVELTFMAPPYGDGDMYYRQDMVYPILTESNKLMIVRGRRGCVQTSQYEMIFIYANKACKVNLKFNAINPRSREIPLVEDIPVPTTLDICCVETNIAWSVMNAQQLIVYTAAVGFEKVAAVIKNTVEYYAQPNPLLAPITQVAAVVENTTVIIVQNLKPYGSANVDRKWTDNTNATDQYGNKAIYKAGVHGIGGLINNKPYNPRTHYPIVSIALTIPINKVPVPLPPLDIWEFQFLLRQNVWPYYGALAGIRTSTYDNVAGRLSSNPDYVIWPQSFALTSRKLNYDNFCVSYYQVTSALGLNVIANGDFKVKVTFRKIEEVIPPPPDWDPFEQSINVLTGTDFFVIPNHEQTVGAALVVGGGGGGGGSLSNSADSSILSVSGGGGGRGDAVRLDGLRMAYFDNTTQTYVNAPVYFKIGKGGAGGLTTDLTVISGQPGENSQLSYIPNGLITAAGGMGSNSPNGANSGGGGGVSVINLVVAYGTAGNAGQGQPGNIVSTGTNVGGSGGSGPIVDFPTIASEASPGKLGIESNIAPAGGGAGGITTTDGIQYGYGGTGGDAAKTEGGEAGRDGYICLVTGYIAY